MKAELQRQYQEGAGLRELAAAINQRLLEAALMEANVSVVGDMENIYETLRGDEVSVRQRAEMSETVSNYLNDCLENDPSCQQQLTIEEALKIIEWVSLAAKL